MRKKWIEIKNWKILYFEIILIHFDVLLLFVCVDSEEQKYLVLCEDEEIGEYLIIKCTSSMLLNMLNGKVSMDDTFKSAIDEEVYITVYNFDSSTFSVISKNIADIPKDMLPDEGSLFNLHNDNIQNYISKLQSEASESNVFKGRIKKFTLDKSNNWEICKNRFYLSQSVQCFTTFKIDEDDSLFEIPQEGSRISFSTKNESIYESMNGILQ